MEEETGLGREGKWATIKSSAKLRWSTGTRDVDSRIVRNWAKEPAFMSLSSTIRFGEGEVTQLPWKWKLNFVLLAFNTPRIWGNKRSSPRKGRWEGGCFQGFYLAFLVTIALSHRLSLRAQSVASFHCIQLHFWRLGNNQWVSLGILGAKPRPGPYLLSIPHRLCVQYSPQCLYIFLFSMYNY